MRYALSEVENTIQALGAQETPISTSLVAIAIAGSESEELTINQSGNANDLASNVNLRNAFPDRFTSLV